MTIVRYLRAGRQRLAMLAALLATVAAGLFAGTGAQGQSCRDLANLTVCADRIDPQSVGPDDIFATGNIKLGPRGAPPVVHVTDLEDPAEGGFFRALEGRVHVIGGCARPFERAAPCSTARPRYAPRSRASSGASSSAWRSEKT